MGFSCPVDVLTRLSTLSRTNCGPFILLIVFSSPDVLSLCLHFLFLFFCCPICIIQQQKQRTRGKREMQMPFISRKNKILFPSKKEKHETLSDRTAEYCYLDYPCLQYKQVLRTLHFTGKGEIG
ncbi:hypothetical protein ABZP36_025805 [Zizania latifolia]